LLIDIIMISRVNTFETFKENLGSIIYDAFMLVIIATVLMFLF
jgi:hypothetical protein